MPPGDMPGLSTDQDRNPSFHETTTDGVREKQVGRAAFVDRLRALLTELAEEAGRYEPFQHGTFYDQAGHELLTLRVELGDPIAIERRARRNQKIPPSLRLRVYKRDDYTCQDCGWRSPPELADRRIANRSGLYLTIDHIIPRAEGGATTQANLRTLCSRCNSEKGHALDPQLETDSSCLRMA